jgi:two-component system response regulator FlrC
MNQSKELALQDEMVAVDPGTRRLMKIAQRVAVSDVTVMICGESGTGKEVLARLIHSRSTRAAGPFVAINCAAIPENMLEAVLFGYERGAYTGAYQSRPGKFEQAQGGTLLLDEISEMDLGLQAKLLRVLQEREVERLGSHEIIPLDVRVVATTNRNLREQVNRARFREDLYYRLNVFPLLLPPLRARTADILPLAKELILRHSHGANLPELSPAAENRLRSYQWPGNVRELENVIQRALILNDGDQIEVSQICLEAEDSLLPVADRTPQEVPVSAGAGVPLDTDLRMRERELIIQALEAERGSRKEAAARLGISPRTLRYKMARLREAGIDIPRVIGM